jgi:hypothetical protein
MTPTENREAAGDAAAPSPLAAALADRYRIERELGAGGMATQALQKLPADRFASAAEFAAALANPGFTFGPRGSVAAGSSRRPVAVVALAAFARVVESGRR